MHHRPTAGHSEVREIEALYLDLIAAAAPRTFPSTYPRFSLDRIWISLPAKIKSSQAHITALSRTTSDHPPLKALVEWR